MVIEVTAADPDSVGADLVAAAAGARASELGAPERAAADADPVAIVYRDGARLAVVALEPDVEGLRTAAARAVRACRGGGTVAWALDSSLPLAVEEQVRALAEGAVIGGYDGRRWRSAEPPRGVERFVICDCVEQPAPVADRAALVARWTNAARELVDAPPNVISPAGLAERAAALPGLTVQTLDAVEAGLGALAAVGGSSPIPPRLIVLRHAPPGAPDTPRLALVGKAVTFDTGGYFLKPQHDIVRQKAAQHRGQELRLPDRRRHVPCAVRRGRAVGPRRHARAGAARRGPRRRVRPRGVRLWRPHARRARHSPEPRACHVRKRAGVTLAR